MKKYLLLIILFISNMFVMAQTQLYFEDFNSGTSTSWHLNTTVLSGDTATNHNYWLIGNAYAGCCLGLIPATPNEPAGVTGSPESYYLHITNGANSGLSDYNANCEVPATGIQVASMNTPVNTSGYSDVTLSFWYLCDGGPNYYGMLYYSLNGGTTWEREGGSYEGISTWTKTTISDPAWTNASSLEFAFQWTQLGGSAESDPALAVDDFKVTGVLSSLCHVNITENTITPPTCFASNNGAIDITAIDSPTGLTLTYKIISATKIDSNYTGVFTGLAPAVYQVSVADSTGCLVLASDTISQTPVSVALVSYIPSGCQNNGQLVISASGGTAPYSYLWSNSQTGDSLSNLTPGMYLVTATDRNGCVFIDTFQVKQEYYYVFLEPTNPTCTNNGSIITQVSANGVPPFTYLWSNGKTTGDLNNLNGGTYAVTITDSTGCITTGNRTIYANCYPVISGTVFVDSAGSCQYNGTQQAIPNVLLTLSGGPQTQYATTNNNGFYSFSTTDTGTYHIYIQQGNNTFCGNFTLCGNASQNITVSAANDSSTNNNFALSPSSAGFDLFLHPGWTSGAPGFEKDYWIYFGNNSPIHYNGNVAVSFKYDSKLIFLSSDIPYTYYDASTDSISWVVSNFDNTTWNRIGDMRFMVPDSLASGYQLHSQYWIFPFAGDCDTSNNYLSYYDPISGAHDPNAKTVTPSGAINNSDSVLIYTIYYQNTGSDSTNFIIVKDTLSPYLNPASVQNLASSDTFSSFAISGSGILTWTFNALRLVDSATNPQGSKGFIIYSVKPIANIPSGTSITNTASIYFDYNPAIVTNTVTDTVASNPCTVTYGSINTSICNNDTFFIGHTPYTQIGNYTDTLSNAAGCDSIVSLNLSVYSAAISNISQTICAGQSYLGYDSTSVYVDTLRNAAMNGCDSIRTLNLKVNPLPVINPIANQTVCAGYPVTPITFSGNIPNAIYNWTNSDTTIGLASAGVGSIASFTAVNNGSVPVTAAITATPIIWEYAYIASSFGTVYVINTATNLVTAKIQVGNEPWGVSVSPDNSKVYVTNFLDNTVSVINTGTNTVVATVQVGTYPIGICVSPDGSKVYVANDVSRGSVSVIDAATNTVAATIDVPLYPFGIAISPDGSKVFVASLEDSVSVISTATNLVTNKIVVGKEPTGLAISPDGNKLYVTNEDDASVSVINVATNAVVATIPVGAVPYGICTNSDGSKVFVACDNPSPGIWVINNNTNMITDTITLPAGPNGVSATVNGSEVYAVDDSVSVVNPYTNTITATIPAGINPKSFGNFISSNTNCSSPPLTFTITVNPAPKTGTASQTICAGQSYMGHTAAGIYMDTLYNAASNGCDSIVLLTLLVHILPASNISQIICDGQSYLGHTVAGNYIDTLLNAASNGCDSIVMLKLTVYSAHISNISQTICAGQSYLGYTTAGNYVDTLLNAASNGCDSIVMLSLSVDSIIHTSNASQTICAGQSFQGHTATGNYLDTLFNAASNGCDSIVILNLTVDTIPGSIISQTICAGQSYLGYTATGNYFDTLYNAGANGCDSIVTLHLLVNPIRVGAVLGIICNDSGSFSLGNYFTTQQAGFYPNILVGTAANGCDSLVNLTVEAAYNYNTPIVIHQLGDTLIAYEPGYSFYTWVFNDSVIENGSSVIVVNKNGTYVVYTFDSLGCTSLTPGQINVDNLSINAISATNAISLYPNPTTDQLYIKTEGIKPETIIIYDVNGRMITTLPFQPELDVSKLSSGVYLIEVKSNMGVARKRFVKM